MPTLNFINIPMADQSLGISLNLRVKAITNKDARIQYKQFVHPAPRR